MDVELIRQIGSGIASLDARMLQHVSASAKDRAATLQKIDDLRDHFETRFDDLGSRIDDVCDKRQMEHGGFEDRLRALETRIAVQEARSEGRRDILAPIGSWAKQNWLAIVFALYVGWQTIGPAIHAALPIRGILP